MKHYRILDNTGGLLPAAYVVDSMFPGRVYETAPDPDKAIQQYQHKLPLGQIHVKVHPERGEILLLSEKDGPVASIRGKRVTLFGPGILTPEALAQYVDILARIRDYVSGASLDVIKAVIDNGRRAAA